ncbi:MAG: N-acetyltransferase [Labilithrix sp.]|nr:N-acetyltransferase [Labilithrix sp.]
MACVLDRFRRRLEIVVRHCEASDLPALEWFGSFSPHRGFMEEQFVRHGRGENVMLVADHAGFPVGQVWIDLVTQAGEGIATIWALRVIASLQRLGIGMRLLAAGEGVARAAGFDAAEIGVEHDNPGVRNWYERIGYRFVRDEVIEQTYRSADGDVSQRIFDQAILRKSLRAAVPSGLTPTRS